MSDRRVVNINNNVRDFGSLAIIDQGKQYRNTWFCQCLRPDK